ncbi:DUF4870 domain-containing protein [Nostoc sp. TCL240-02]|uniref:DUF4870 domain-containing protein n=1 Tax=Nostoc sp. TCL240-02 TaxID=2572090 RepID=UPI0020C68CF1|nr:DUF4870 domain-containing protein [Nostoc sp. TCL240-02]
MEDIQQRKLLSALSHGAIFFSSTIISIGIPIAILLISNDPIIKSNAKESLNFHINLYIYAIIFALLTVVGIGILLLIALGVVSFIREHPSFLQRRRKSVRIGKTSVFTYR